MQLEFFTELVTHAEWVRANAVELVDECNARHFVATHLTIHRIRLRLHAGHATKHHDGAVEHAQRAFNFDGEVNVSRGVDDVDVVLGDAAFRLRTDPFAERRSRLNRDAALALEFHRVHLGANAVFALHFVNGVNTAGVKKDALGQRGFATVDVRRNADVANFREVGNHVKSPRVMRAGAR